MGGIADVYGRLQKAIGATEGIVNILEEKIEENSSNKNLDIDIRNQKSPIISFQNVDFAYTSRSDLLVLQSLNLDVLPGDQLAIVGPSGAGKSTIMQLLLRFQVPTSGEIYFFGEKSSSYSKNFIRKQMGWVPQDVILFGQSIRENILYGNIKSTEDDLMSAVKESNSFEFIDKFPNGLDTEIGERGVQLSGGQRQRIAIARAMLKDPQVLLLDEATSSLDAENESVVQEALDRLMKNKTSVIIAHRLSTVRNANKIAFLNEGRVLELGSHEELMNLSSGSYKKFVKQQLH